MDSDNPLLTEDQLAYIKSINPAVPTTGMDLGVAHGITVLENSIKRHIEVLLGEHKDFIRTKKHNDSAFAGLVRQVDRRESLASNNGRL